MKNLIEKYFDGETSLQEEAELRRYFNSGEVDESLKMYQPLFQHFEKTQQSLTLGSDFDEKLLARLAEGGKVVRMKTWQRRLLQVAAVAAVAAGVFILTQNQAMSGGEKQTSVNWEKYEIKDEQLAYEETVKALRLLSSKMNKGSKKASREVEKIEKVSKYFN